MQDPAPPPLPKSASAPAAPRADAAPLFCVPCAKRAEAPGVRCRACGRTAPRDASFCPGCGGTDLGAVPVCASCGAPLVAEYFPPRKAAFRSLLLGPGFGQFYTKRYLRGSIYLATLVWSLAGLIQWGFRLYAKLSAALQAGAGLDVESILRSCPSGNYGNAILAVWILSTVDAYVTARAANARAALEAADRLAAEK